MKRIVLFLAVTFMLVTGHVYSGIIKEDFNNGKADFVAVSGKWKAVVLRGNGVLGFFGRKTGEVMVDAVRLVFKKDYREFSKGISGYKNYGFLIYQKVGRFLDGSIKVDLEIKNVNKKAEAGIIFDVKKSGSMLLFGYDFFNKEAFLLGLMDGSVKVLQKSSTISDKESKSWVKLKVVTSSKHVSCYINNKKVFDFRNEYYIDGKIGLVAYIDKDSKAYFDNFVVNYDEYNKYGGGCGCY